MSRLGVYRAINSLVKMRARLKVLEKRAAAYRRIILQAGGGETKMYVARIVEMPAHTTTFPATEQVRIFKRSAK